MTSHSFSSCLYPSKPWDGTSFLPLPLPAQIIVAWSLSPSHLTHFDYNIFHYHYLILNFFSQSGTNCNASFQLSTEWQFNKGGMNRMQFLPSFHKYLLIISYFPGIRFGNSMKNKNGCKVLDIVEFILYERPDAQNLCKRLSPRSLGCLFQPSQPQLAFAAQASYWRLSRQSFCYSV